MINLSKRLSLIASMVRSNARLVDIGCDHALLDIYLKTKFPHLKAIAVDVRTGAIKQAQQNILKYNMNEDIDVRLGNGLEVVNKSEIDTIVISGLGCPKIIEILTSDSSKLDNVTDMIIQSNTDFHTLRKKVCSLGFYIKDEQLVKDNDIIYVVIHFERGTCEYTLDDYLWGPFLRHQKSPLYKELLQKDLNKKEILYSLIPPANCLKRQQLKKNILKLREELK